MMVCPGDHVCWHATALSQPLCATHIHGSSSYAPYLPCTSALWEYETQTPPPLSKAPLSTAYLDNSPACSPYKVQSVCMGSWWESICMAFKESLDLCYITQLNTVAVRQHHRNQQYHSQHNHP